MTTSSPDYPAIPKVSVVCAFYNRPDHIRETVDSLLAQDLDDIEVLIINDGSPNPRVREILDSYSDPRLTVIHQENHGFAATIKKAVQLTKAPLIAIMGAGDTSHPARLRRQMEVMESDPELSLVGCYYDKHNTVTGERSVVKPTTPKTGDFVFDGLSHGELMYRRRDYDEAGGYRTIFYIGQGSDLWMRLLRKRKAHIIPEVLYTQRLFSDGVSMSAKDRVSRGIIDSVKIENELHFRKTGVDLVNVYGTAAFVVLAYRPRVLRTIIGRKVALLLAKDKGSAPPIDVGAFSSFMARLIYGWRKLTGKTSSLTG